MILNLEQQVCSLESAKRLKELGVKQESLFYWVKRWDPTSAGIGEHFELHWERDLEEQDMDLTWSAYTVSELGEVLPRGFWHITKGDRFHITCVNSSGHPEAHDNEAETRAKMLIYLLENKLASLDTLPDKKG